MEFQMLANMYCAHPMQGTFLSSKRRYVKVLGPDMGGCDLTWSLGLCNLINLSFWEWNLIQHSVFEENAGTATQEQHVKKKWHTNTKG
jgi:hypothetical protein